MRRPRSVLAATLLISTMAACLSGGSGGGSRSVTVGPATPPASTAPASTPAPSTPVSPTAPATPTPTRTSTHQVPHPTAASSSATASGVRRSLPLSGTTAGAEQAITVVASSPSRTTAQLQAWQRVAGGWRRSGPEITAHVGSGGIGRASEGSTRTPAGSFTLTQAFGHDSDPGTRLPYVRTTPDDWWISQPSSPLYNTRQRCASRCSFTRGDPNEHLYYETPFYDYAVVIDYNTANAPGGIRPGAGSAFFLHVTDGNPTAGCVSIPQDRLVTILRWLRPGDHPRILIGVS